MAGTKPEIICRATNYGDCKLHKMRAGQKCAQLQDTLGYPWKNPCEAELNIGTAEQTPQIAQELAGLGPSAIAATLDCET